MTVNGLVDCTDTLKLFRECNLEQVRDYDLELSSRIHKTRAKFREELKTHYKDILKVTDEVDHLHLELKEGDALFMDLCFKDDLFKLTKLPEFQNKADHQDVQKTDLSTNETSFQPVLVVSQWVLSISDLISRFATSHSSSKLFDNVIQSFEDLKSMKNSLSEYENVIKDKCYAFLQFSCRPEVTYNLLQRIQVYNLVTKGTAEILPWDTELVADLENQTFSFILQDHLDETLNSHDDLASTFIRAEKFKQKLSFKLKQDISSQFEDLDGLLSAEQKEVVKSEIPMLSTSDIQELIRNCQYYSMGLVTDKKVQWYRTVDSLIDSIQKLERYGDKPLGQELRKELIEKLQKANTVTTSMSDSVSMSDLVSKVVADFNSDSLRKTIELTIESLSVQQAA